MRASILFLALALSACGKPLPVPIAYTASPPVVDEPLSAEELDLQNRVACNLKGLTVDNPKFEACLREEAGL